MPKTAAQATQSGLINQIQNLLQVVGSQKSAEANTEAGGYQGGTTHPVKNVDDGTQEAAEGSRSSENESDVKEDQGKPGVDSTSPGAGSGQDAQQSDVGMTSKATGEDPSAETESAKGGKEDGGTYFGSSTHPARTDNDSLDGGKYASDTEHFAALCKQAQDLGNSLIAAIAASTHTTNKAAESGAGDKVGLKNEKASAPANDKAAADAGKQAADLAAAQALDAERQQLIASRVYDTIKFAEERAIKLHHAMSAYEKQSREMAQSRARGKRAEEQGDGDNDSDDEDGGAGAKGDEGKSHDAPPAHHGEHGGGGDDAALMSLLQGGDQMDAGGALQGMSGGMDAGAGGASGGHGVPGAGGPVEGDMGHGSGEIGGDDLAMLSHLLDSLGIKPEQLVQLLTSGAGGAGAAPAPAAPPAAPPAPAPKMASAGKPTWEPKTAADRARYKQAKAVLLELFSRNRGNAA